MRPLTSQEKRLIPLFLGLIFIVANLFFFSLGSRALARMIRENADLTLQVQESERWIAEKDLWRQRADWINANQPPMTSPGEAQSGLLQSLRDLASANSLKVEDPKFDEPATNTHYREAALTLKVSGPLKGFVTWLNELQQPGAFHTISSLSLAPDGESLTDVVCTLRVARWHAP